MKPVSQIIKVFSVIHTDIDGDSDTPFWSENIEKSLSEFDRISEQSCFGEKIELSYESLRQKENSPYIDFLDNTEIVIKREIKDD